MNFFDNPLENWYANYIGECFERSVKDQFDSYVFANEFMHSKWGIGLLLEDHIKEYNSLPYMYAKARRNLNLKIGVTYDTYVMWMYGFLIKYWLCQEDVTPTRIWDILPINKFESLFGFYHTQGWNYIISDAKRRYSGTR